MWQITSRQPRELIWILDGQQQVAEVYADWDEREACVLRLRSDEDRPEVARILGDYWPSLNIVWPEEITIEEVRI